MVRLLVFFCTVDGAVVITELRCCCGNVHDLISMTLMKGRLLLVWVDGLSGLL